MPSGLENCFVKHLDASNNPCMSNVEVFARFPALSLQVQLILFADFVNPQQFTVVH